MSNANKDTDSVETYELWATCDLWPLEDAAVLAMGDPPRQLGSEGNGESMSSSARKLYEVALNCAGHTLQIERSEVRDGRLMVEPRAFLSWLQQRGLAVPTALDQALEEVRGALQGHTGTRRVTLRPEQRHRERTCGLAAYLWSEDPTVRIGDMAARLDLWRVTCEGHSYSQEKIREWLKSVAPDEARKSGRPRKAAQEKHKNPGA